jgi:ribosome maturation factor RimP
MSATDRQTQELHVRLRPLISELGFDLEDVHVTRVGRRTLVKIVVDGDDGLELDDVAEVSRAVDAHLDADDPFSGPFVLEVSSPGVDRPLTEPRHWRRNVTRLVEVELLHQPQDRDHKLTGRVAAADDVGVTFEVDGAQVEVRYPDLGPGRVQIEFNRPSTSNRQGS